MQTKLHLPHVGGGCNLAGALLIHGGIWITKVHVIGRVEVFPFELDGFSLRDCERLPQAEVEFIEARTAQRIVAHQAVSADALRRHEGRGVEPQIRAGIWNGGIANPIGQVLSFIGSKLTGTATMVGN